jgi:SPP1 gp7 family putative phage head morphogenesis protein
MAQQNPMERRSQPAPRNTNSSITQRPNGIGKTALVKLNRNLLITDKAPRRKLKVKTGRAERLFNSQLRGVAHHVGVMVKGFTGGDDALVSPLMQMLRAYSDALKPWAVSVSKRMLGEVDLQDRQSWRAVSKHISQQLRHDVLNTDLGEVMRGLMDEQVELIQSLPIEAGQRVHKLTLRALENSERAESIADEIMKTGEVTASRATLIARTEVARTAAILSQARATSAGLTHYIWQTAEDGDVRPGHKAMQGKVCEYAHPPAVRGEDGSIEHYHPGETFNCRCWAEAVI